MEEANGGNAEMAMETSNLKSTENLSSSSPAAAGKKIDEPSSPMDSQAALSPSVTNNTPNEQIKMEEDEVNGDLKPDVNKKSDITVKRKLRKSKSNSTSSVETDAKQKTRGHKRKSPDIDNNNPTIENDDENIDDFIGFDCKKKDNDHVLKLLLKLIAEAEIEDSPLAPLPKRGRLLSKGRQSVGISDEKTKQIESPKIKNNVGADLTNNSLTEKSSKLIEKIETNNSIYKEPFKYGWRRELIYKGLPDVNNKKSADVYYYSPKGKKVKNIKEVGDCLTTKELTVDNFTFNTEPIGVDDPALEVIRDTKRLRSEAIGGGATPVKKTVVGKRVSIGKKVSPVQPGKTTGPKVMLPKNSGNAATATAGFKVKLPSVKRGSLKKEQRAPKESESLPAQWPPATPSRRAPAPLEKSSPPKTKRTIQKKKTLAVEPDKSQYFMASICAGYNALPRIFQYLKVQELLRASRVCKMWHDLASRKVLWKTVRLKNSQVTDWNGLVECLNRHNTENLDLRKMIIPGEQDLCWNNLIQVISTIKSLVKLDLCRCPSTFVEDIMKNCTKIQVLNAITIKCQSLSLSNIDNMINCKELRLKAINSMTISDLSSIEKLDKLTLLSLTSIKDLGKQNIDIIGSLINLEILELGECSDFPASFGTNVLEKLIKLEKIRLEKGQGTCCTFDILDSLSKMKKIQELELINFDVKQGFDQRLAKCCNLKKLLIIPTYISQSATSNNMVLGGVTQLADSLEVFVWGVTRELLGVTDIFIQQSSDNNKEDLTASIPVLKPVPCVKLIEDGHNEKIDEKDEKSLNTTKPQIDVLPLAKVEKLLAAALPNTRVEILKIRFAETWRQSISDTQLQ